MAHLNNSMTMQDVFIHVDLRSFSSDSHLHSRVFESSQFTAWRNGNTQLTLSLDSLDEALLRIDNIAALLADELPQHPTARMSVRIASRTAVWPHGLLEPTLKRIWGEDAVGVFELAPLRRKDVEEAARQRGVDPKRFIYELQNSNAVPLALKPVTLNLLFEIFVKDGHLPDRAVDLYSQGCLRLCGELSANRRAAGRLGRLNGLQRKQLAGRIAAVTMLANRYAVSTNPDTDPRAEEDVALSALCTGSETGEFQPFDVSDDHLREVLDTGLFSSHGVGRMGWAHQTYAEFLAADYLIAKQTSSENVLRILCHPSGGLIPQLLNVAASVTSRHRAVRSALIQREPFALLRGDLSSWGGDDRAALTSALLTACDEERAHDFAFGLMNDYRKLAQPGLADLLRNYIVDSQRNVIARPGDHLNPTLRHVTPPRNSHVTHSLMPSARRPLPAGAPTPSAGASRHDGLIARRRRLSGRGARLSRRGAGGQRRQCGRRRERDNSGRPPTPHRCGRLGGGKSIYHAVPRLRCLSAHKWIKVSDRDFLEPPPTTPILLESRHVPVASLFIYDTARRRKG